MANYITRPAIDRTRSQTDIQQLMPYLQNEIATIRNNDTAKISTMNAMRSAALADPDKYRNTKFHIDSDGMVQMNEAAKALATPQVGRDYSQDAVNESSEVISDERTNAMNKAQFDMLNNEEGRQNAIKEQRELNQIDSSKLAQLAMNRQDARGQDLVGDNQIAMTADALIAKTEADKANTATTPPTTAPTTVDVSVDNAFAGNGQTNDPFASSLGGTKPQDAYSRGLANVSNNTVQAQPLTNSTAQPKQASEVLATGNSTQKADALATKYPDKNVTVKEGQSEGSSKSQGEKASYTITKDTSVGDSKFDNDVVKVKTTRTQQGIIDQDPSEIRSLKTAAAIESFGNMALAGRPGATQSLTMANRLAKREAFLNEIQNVQRGVATNITESGGNSKINLGGVKASITATSGASTENSVTVNNKSDNRTQIAAPSTGDRNAQDNKFMANGISGDGLKVQFDLKNGNIVNNMGVAQSARASGNPGDSNIDEVLRTATKKTVDPKTGFTIYYLQGGVEFQYDPKYKKSSVKVPNGASMPQDLAQRLLQGSGAGSGKSNSTDLLNAAKESQNTQEGQ